MRQCDECGVILNKHLRCFNPHYCKVCIKDILLVQREYVDIPRTGLNEHSWSDVEL